jgi:hypothetical protein
MTQMKRMITDNNCFTFINCFQIQFIFFVSKPQLGNRRHSKFEVLEREKRIKG